MIIELLTDPTLRNPVAGCHDDGEGGVFGYGGRHSIPPPFQRGESLKYDTIMVT